MIVSAQCDLRYALLVDLELQSKTTGTDWLSKDELATWRRFRSEVRRDTFLAGRILAKRLLRAEHCAASNAAPSQITIRSNDASSGVRPYIRLGGDCLEYSLSISHTSDAVLVGGTNRCGVSVGVDLVEMRSLGAGFQRTWLTDAEIDFLENNENHTTVADIWAMKEAVYKAVNSGDSFAPRSVEICLKADGATITYHGRNISDRCKLRIWRFHSQIAAVATYQRLKAVTPPHTDKHAASMFLLPNSDLQSLSRPLS